MLEKDTNLIIGKINSGKTRGVLLKEVKNIIDKNENLLILDSKEEYYKTFYNELKKQNYNILVVNLKNPNNSNGYNPLLLPYQFYKNGNKDKAMELLSILAHEIFKEDDSNDPFWENMASDYFLGLALILFKEGNIDEINLGSIQIMLNQSENKFNETTIIKKYLDNISPLDSIYISISGTAFAPNETKGSIMSVIKQKIKEYCYRENLLNLLCTNEINLSDLKEKTAIFIIGNNSINKLANIFINQLVEVIQTTNLRFNLILDNFNTLPTLSNFKQLIENATYYNLKINVAIIDLDEMESMYGKYVFNKFQNVITLENEINLEQIGNEAIYPNLENNNNKYFNFEEFVKTNL